MWRDVHQMQVGDDWRRQITEAIEGSHTMILCMSPGAIASTVVAQEWQRLREEPELKPEQPVLDDLDAWFPRR